MIVRPSTNVRWRRAAAVAVALAWCAGATALRSASPSPEVSVPSQLPFPVPVAPQTTPAPLVEAVLPDPSLPAAAASTRAVAEGSVEGAEDHGVSGLDGQGLVVVGDRPAARERDAERLKRLETHLNLARQQRREKEFDLARRTLMEVLQANTPEELKQAGLVELALVAQDAGELLEAQRLFAQYVATYPQHLSVPEILLRQGLLYRRMGVSSLAIAKFMAVLTSTVNFKMEQLEDFKRLALLAKAEIAETYYLTGRYEDAAGYYSRLLKEDSAHLNRQAVLYKLVRCLAAVGNHAEAANQADRFLTLYPESAELPEVRFILATAYKQTGRAVDAQRQVLLLLESQRDRARRNPEAWVYWQKRAGNEIANQFYQEGQFAITLTIYRHLAELDSSPAWRIPVWYQIGLVYERLLQPQKAAEVYQNIIDLQKELTAEARTPSLEATVEMAGWRKDALGWIERAEAKVAALQTGGPATPK